MRERIAILVEMETRIRQYRKELNNPKLTQERLANMVGITVQWLRCLEISHDQATSYTTANALLKAINTERMTRGLDELTLDQLDLKIV